jgi:outer membrane protein assembly factor BamB
VLNGLVIVGMNARMAAAYDARTGKRVWVRKLDGPSVFGPLLFRRLLLVVTDSIYLLRPETGKVVRKFSWKRDGVSRAECTDKNVLATLRGSWPPDGNIRLVGLDQEGIKFVRTCRAFVAVLRYARDTKLIYVSHLEGIDVRHAGNGALTCKIERKVRSSGNGLVDVQENKIYVRTSDGYVYALRHPPITKGD